MPFQATQVSTPISSHSRSGTNLYRAVHTRARATRQVGNYFSLQTQVCVVSSQVRNHQVGVGQFVRRAVRIDRTVHDFRLREFKGLMANDRRPERITLFGHRRLTTIAVRRVHAQSDIRAQVVVSRGNHVIVRTSYIRVITQDSLLRAASVRTRAVRIFMMKVLVFLFPIDRRMGSAFNFIRFRSLICVPKTTYSTILRIAFSIVRMRIHPTIAFTPLSRLLTVACNYRQTSFLVDVRAFLSGQASQVLSSHVQASISAIRITTQADGRRAIVITRPSAHRLFPVAIFLPPQLAYRTRYLVFRYEYTSFLVTIIIRIRRRRVLSEHFFLAKRLMFVNFRHQAEQDREISCPRIFRNALIFGHRNGVAKVK